VSEKNANAPASANGKPAAQAAVIRRMDAAEESSQERLIKKHVPAWVVSGAIHVAVIALMILFLGKSNTEAKQPEQVLATTAEKVDEPEDPNLTNPDPGFDSNLEAALPEIERVDKATVDALVSQDNIGQPNAAETDTTALAAPGLNASDLAAPGVMGDTGSFMSGGSGNNGALSATFPGRSGATKSRLIREGGGTGESERAVALGLAWLARQQKQDGGWEYDVGQKEHKAAATGMSLLPFLAAGVTHKPNKDNKDNKYQKTVQAGLNWLCSRCPPSGPKAGQISTNMYEQAIATIPLCEAYGMTKDPALHPYAQAAINFIQRAQGPNGSWGYGPGGNGDTSIVGWQVQALAAARLSKLVVDDRVIKKAISFLNLAAGGSRKSMYGYADSAGAAPGTPLTAVGLLCRYYIDSWGPSHPGMIDGVAGLVKNPPLYKGAAVPGVSNMYYYYYATQVVHFYEGEDWKNWNEGIKGADGTRKGGMRDWLVKSQNKKDGANLGSWDPEGGFFGTSCGRVGTTAMCLLTLEVYYRHLPLYKRGADGNAVKILEDK
jgi:hypothetical protein